MTYEPESDTAHGPEDTAREQPTATSESAATDEINEDFDTLLVSRENIMEGVITHW